MQNVYIKYLMRRLTNEFEIGIQDKLERSFTIRLLIFFSFCALLLTLYVLFWIPTISTLNKEVPPPLIIIILFFRFGEHGPC